MNIVQKISDFIYRIEKILAILLLIVMTGSLVAGVVFRYFLHSPLTWSDEVATLTLVWITFLGGSICIKNQQLATVDILIDKLKGKTRRFLLSLGLLIVVLFCLYFLSLSVKWISNPMISFERSDALQLPMIIPYSSVPIGILFMSIHFINMFLLALRGTEEEGN